MPRGGRRANAGRPALRVSTHLLQGSYRPGRHGPRLGTVGALATAAPEPAAWMPSPADVEALGERARRWLAAVLRTHIVGELDGLRLLLALGTLSRIEALEAGGPSAELVRERKLFLAEWSSLQLER